MEKRIFLHTIENAIIDAHADVTGVNPALEKRMALARFVSLARDEARVSANGTWPTRRSGVLDDGQIIGIFDELSTMETDFSGTPWKLIEEVLFNAEEKVCGLAHDEDLLQRHLAVVHELRESNQ